MEQNDADYLILGDQSWYPGTLGAVPYLSNSGAFRVAHEEELGHQRESTNNPQALVLLRRTTAAPDPAPTRMNAETVNRLVECEKAEGSEGAQEVRARFPNGIALEPAATRGPTSDDEAKINARANEAIEEIYPNQ